MTSQPLPASAPHPCLCSFGPYPPQPAHKPSAKSWTAVPSAHHHCTLRAHPVTSNAIPLFALPTQQP